MADDLYDDAPAAAPAPPDDAGAKDEGDAGGSKTAILPKTLCPNAKPGDMISCKVTRVNENDIEVEPQGGEVKEDEQPPPDDQAAPADDGGDQGGGEMRSMLED